MMLGDHQHRRLGNQRSALYSRRTTEQSLRFAAGLCRNHPSHEGGRSRTDYGTAGPDDLGVRR